MLSLASELKDLRSKWQTLSIYERFEQTVVAVLTRVIAIIVAIATWQLLLHTLRLVGSHVVNPADPQVFKDSLEFKHTLLVVKHHRRAIVQVRAVVLIALLALVRRFIILDLYQTTPSALQPSPAQLWISESYFPFGANRVKPTGAADEWDSCG